MNNILDQLTIRQLRRSVIVLSCFIVVFLGSFPHHSFTANAVLPAPPSRIENQKVVSPGGIVSDKFHVSTATEPFQLQISDSKLNQNGFGIEQYTVSYFGSNTGQVNYDHLFGFSIRLNGAVIPLNSGFNMTFLESGPDTGIFTHDLKLKDVLSHSNVSLTNGDRFDFILTDLAETIPTQSVATVMFGHPTDVTSLQLNAIPSVTNNTVLTFSGTLLDLDTGKELGNQTITIDGNGTMVGGTHGARTVQTQGIVIRDRISLNINYCPSTQAIPQNWQSDPAYSWVNDSDINTQLQHMNECVPNGEKTTMVLRLHQGAYMTFPNSTKAVSMILQQDSADGVTVLVTEGNGSSFKESSRGYCPDATKFVVASKQGIRKIEISGIDPSVPQDPTRASICPTHKNPGDTDTIGISSIESFDTNAYPQDQISVDFQGLPPGPNPQPMVFHNGSFFSTGKSYPIPSTSPLVVQAHYAGDSTHSPADSPVQLYYSLFPTITSSSLGAGGEPTGGISSDSGIGITTIQCSRDNDGDGLCTTWEATGSSAGIPYSVGGVTHYYKLNWITNNGGSPNDNQKDVYIQLDYMNNHQPNQTAYQDVSASFIAHGIHLHTLQNALGFERQTLNVWTDTDANYTNDFDSIKQMFFGNSSERGCQNDHNYVPYSQCGTSQKILLSSSMLSARANAVHYGIFADSIVSSCGPSGVAEIMGNDFVVSLGCGFGPYDQNGHPLYADSPGTGHEQEGTLMHELGHNFNLDHGGPRYLQQSGFPGVSPADYSMNCKANYPSVMSYSRQFSTYFDNTTKINTSNPPLPWTPSYSNFSGFLPSSLVENNLNEPAGLTGTNQAVVFFSNGTGASPYFAQPRIVKTQNNINWHWDSNNGDTAAHESLANFRIAGCTTGYPQTENQYDDWSNLEFNFRRGLSGIDGVYPLPGPQVYFREATHDVVYEMQHPLAKFVPPVDIIVTVNGSAAVSYFNLTLDGEPVVNDSTVAAASNQIHKVGEKFNPNPLKNNYTTTYSGDCDKLGVIAESKTVPGATLNCMVTNIAASTPGNGTSPQVIYIYKNTNPSGLEWWVFLLIGFIIGLIIGLLIGIGIGRWSKRSRG